MAVLRGADIYAQGVMAAHGGRWFVPIDGINSKIGHTSLKMYLVL
jgi:hypothetical protein